MYTQTIETISRRGCTVTKTAKVIAVISETETYRVNYPFRKQFAHLIPDVLTNIKGRYYICGEFKTACEANDFVRECRNLRNELSNN